MLQRRLPGSTLRVLDSLVLLGLGLAGEFAFLATFQVLLLLLPPGPYFKNQCPRLYHESSGSFGKKQSGILSSFKILAIIHAQRVVVQSSFHMFVGMNKLFGLLREHFY